MSPGKKFDRYMVAVELGGNAKVGRLNDSEFRCLVTGVWALAAKSPIRGALLVGEHAADANDVARQAHCAPAVARRTLHKLRDLGLLERDDELCCFVVHDWGDINPEPRNDPTAAERMRRYRERLKARNDLRNADRNAVTPAVTVTHGEVEVEVEPPLIPPRGNAVEFEEWLLHHEQTTGHTAPRTGTKARAAIVEAFGARQAEGYPLADLKLATVGAHEDEYRRTNGYDTAESVLRPTKVAALIARGRLRGGGGPRRTDVAGDLDRAYGRTAG